VIEDEMFLVLILQQLCMTLPSYKWICRCPVVFGKETDMFVPHFVKVIGSVRARHLVP